MNGRREVLKGLSAATLALGQGRPAMAGAASVANPVYASLIVDDVPSNAAYWARLQQSAFGYTPGGKWGVNWRNLAPAAWFRAQDARDFADVIDEFGVRGKCTFLPCPAGVGRLDREVRGFTKPDLQDLIKTVRERIAPRMDITGEVLTHSMAVDPETGQLLPHGETAWVTHLCAKKMIEPLARYLRQGFEILRNVGIHAHGLTVGGIQDVSGIGEGKSLLRGDHRDVLAQVLLEIEKEFSPGTKTSFLYTGAPPLTKICAERHVPETIHTAADGRRVYELMDMLRDDPLFDVLHGPGNAVEKTTDAMISRDLSSGSFIETAEAGRAVVFTVHGQTLNAMNTGAGLGILKEVLRRFRERYGKRLVWLSSSEMCRKIGV